MNLVVASDRLRKITEARDELEFHRMITAEAVPIARAILQAQVEAAEFFEDTRLREAVRDGYVLVGLANVPGFPGVSDVDRAIRAAEAALGPGQVDYDDDELRLVVRWKTGEVLAFQRHPTLDLRWRDCSAEVAEADRVARMGADQGPPTWVPGPPILCGEVPCTKCALTIEHDQPTMYRKHVPGGLSDYAHARCVEIDEAESLHKGQRKEDEERVAYGLLRSAAWWQEPKQDGEERRPAEVKRCRKGQCAICSSGFVVGDKIWSRGHPLRGRAGVLAHDRCVDGLVAKQLEDLLEDKSTGEDW